MKILFTIILVSLRFTTLGQAITDSLYGTLWIGIENPISIHDSSLINPYLISDNAIITNLGNGEFDVKVTNDLDNKIIQINIYDSLPKSIQKISTLKFLAKFLPYPAFYLDGKRIDNKISKESLQKTEKFDVYMGCSADSMISFQLNSFEIVIDGELFHSYSNNLTPAMIYCLSLTKSTSIRIKNDMVTLLGSPNKMTKVIYGDKVFLLEK